MIMESHGQTDISILWYILEIFTLTHRIVQFIKIGHLMSDTMSCLLRNRELNRTMHRPIEVRNENKNTTHHSVPLLISLYPFAIYYIVEVHCDCTISSITEKIASKKSKDFARLRNSHYKKGRRVGGGGRNCIRHHNGLCQTKMLLSAKTQL